MSDPLLDQLAGSDGPLDPGSTFRERLWQQVEAELVRPAAEPAVAAAVVEPHPADRRPSRAAGALGWIRASRARTVPVAAGLVALLSLGAGVALRDGENPDGEQTVRVVDEPSPGPASPSPVPSLGPPAVVGGSRAPGAPSPSPGPERNTAGAAAAARPGAVPGARSPSPRPWLVWYGSSVGGFSGIYTAVAGNAGTERMVVGGGSYNAQPVLSPDRRRVAWTKGQETASVRSIWIAGADGSNPREIPLAKCAVYSVCEYRWPTFSGDGTRMAFMRGTANSTCTAAENCDEIVVYDTRSGLVSAVGYGDSPEWSPRRAEIAYSGSAGPEPRQACEAMNCADREIRVVEVSGGEPQSRRVGSVLGYAPRFSPDGEWIAYQSAEAAATAVVRRDGTQERLVVGCQQPSWAPDGRLACIMSVDGGSDVFLLDADDEPAQRLTFTRGAEAQFRIYAL